MADYNLLQFPPVPAFHPVPAFQHGHHGSPSPYQLSVNHEPLIKQQTDKVITKDYFESLKCPITLEPFKDPVFIPECGHTFERKALNDLQIKKCPLCNNYFKGDPAKFRVNWIVAEMLDLNIPRTIKEDILAYDAEMARLESNKAIADKVDRFLTYLLRQIKPLSKAGNKKFSYEFEELPEDHYSKAIIDELKVRGYNADICYKTLNIIWQYSK